MTTTEAIAIYRAEKAKRAVTYAAQMQAARERMAEDELDRRGHSRDNWLLFTTQEESRAPAAHPAFA